MGQFIALALLVGGIAFAAGNYPAREELEADRAKQIEEMEAVKEDVSAMQLEQVRLRSSMGSIEKSQERAEKTTTEISQKLDRVIRSTNKQQRRNR
ncbi:MAG: hypothetical protein GY811_23460 [Myxococcales bacterium]|nr:hypothetical protein [Myxococcales bacterium]